jgi:PAS domain S-box-containing protein
MDFPELNMQSRVGELLDRAEHLGPIDSWPKSLRTTWRLMERSKFPMFVAWGEDLCFLYNDAYAPILGAKHPDAFGRPFQQVWSEIWPDISPLVDRALAGEASWLEDLPLTMNRHGFDEQTWFTFSYSPALDDEGGVRGVFCACTETTEKVVAVRRNAEEIDRLSHLFEQAPVFMALLSGPEHRFDLINPAYQQVVGHRDCVGKTVREAFPDLAGQGFFALLDRVYQTGEPFVGRQLPIKLQRKPGGACERAWLDFVYQPVRDSAGSVSGIFASGYEVTELRQAQERLRLAQRAGNIGAFELHPSSRTLTVTEEFCRIWGLEPAETLSLDDTLGAVLPEDVGRLGTDADTPDPQALGYVEYRIRRSDSGEIRWIGRRAEAIQDEESGALRYAGVIYDITDRKKVEQQLVELTETLEEKVAERTADLERAQEALRQAQKMEAVGQLTGGIAHDFNNLLTVVTGNLDMVRRIMDPQLDGRARRGLESALRGAERAASLTQRLLAFSRRQPLQPRPVQLGRLITGMSDLLTRALGETIELQSVTGAGLWDVEVDPNQLESAVLNLAVNARDAMPEGGKLTIEISNVELDAAYTRRESEVAPGAYAMVAVTDTGTGMSRETLDRVFEPFFTTKEVGRGTGLGLSQVYGFIKQSGGHVKIYSEEGQGTTVRLYLPRLQSQGAEAEEEQAPEAPGEGRRDETILVVEDDDDVRLYTVESLRELGYRVLEAHDGPSALRLMERQEAPIDLLLTDVVMPAMNGRELADLASQRQPKLRVLFTTGYARNAAFHAGRLDPGVDLLPKPFTFAALGAKVRSALDRNATERVLVVDGDPAFRVHLLDLLQAIGFTGDEAANASEALGKLRISEGRYDAVVAGNFSRGMSPEALIEELRAIRKDLPVLLAIDDDGEAVRDRFGDDPCVAIVPRRLEPAILRSQLRLLGARCGAN